MTKYPKTEYTSEQLKERSIIKRLVNNNKIPRYYFAKAADGTLERIKGKLTWQVIDVFTKAKQNN